MPECYSLEDDALIKERKERSLTCTTDDIEYAKRYQEDELGVLCCTRERRSPLGGARKTPRGRGGLSAYRSTKMQSPNPKTGTAKRQPRQAGLVEPSHTLPGSKC
jgi:hypothetical protein